MPFLLRISFISPPHTEFFLSAVMSWEGVNHSPVKLHVAIAGPRLLLPEQVYFFSPTFPTSARCTVRDEHLQTVVEPACSFTLLAHLCSPVSFLRPRLNTDHQEASERQAHVQTRMAGWWDVGLEANGA